MELVQNVDWDVAMLDKNMYCTTHKNVHIEKRQQSKDAIDSVAIRTRAGNQNKNASDLHCYKLPQDRHNAKIYLSTDLSVELPTGLHIDLHVHAQHIK